MIQATNGLNIKEGALSYGQVDKVERIRQAPPTIERPKVDSEAINLRRVRAPEDLDTKTYNRIGKVAGPITARPVDITQVEPKREPVFSPGQEVYGTYGAGTFETKSGHKGTFEGAPGGQITFEIGGFKGIMMPNQTAYAYNHQTGESYEMKIRYGDGQFKIGEIKPLTEKLFDSTGLKPMVVQGENPNIKFRYNGQNDIAVSFPDGQGGTVKGQGFMDGKGTMILALSNGGTIQAKYSFTEDGLLQIFSRQALG